MYTIYAVVKIMTKLYRFHDSNENLFNNEEI